MVKAASMLPRQVQAPEVASPRRVERSGGMLHCTQQATELADACRPSTKTSWSPAPRGLTWDHGRLGMFRRVVIDVVMSG